MFLLRCFTFRSQNCVKLRLSICLRNFTAENSDTNKINEEKDVDIFAAAVNEPSESRDFKSWYTQMRLRLTTGSGPVFLGHTTPFPYNPEFRPQPPLPDVVKEHLFTTWKSDTTKWTPRQLSTKYKISIERVKAIIKLKTLQHRMIKEGFRVNRAYLGRIEGYLGAKTPITLELKPSHEIMNSLPPKLVAISQEQSLTAAEAAKLLGRKLRPIHSMIKYDLEGDRPYDPDPANRIAIDKKSLFIRTDPYETSRWRFIFTDISKLGENENRIIIREPNGDLRRAHSSEILI